MIPVAVFGALGRMGKLVQTEQFSEIEIVQTFDQGDELILKPQVSVVVDFSLPVAWHSLDILLQSGSASLVSGTTGLQHEHRELLRKWSAERAVFYSSNMSIGVYVLQKLMIRADELLGDGYDRELIEFHHNRKADSPSGTALTLLENWPGERIFGREGASCARRKGQIGVHAVRGGDITGEHHLHYLGQGERITISHIASDRRVFALGALRAVEFIAGKEPGLYSMGDMLD